jgi:hypothetical protein
MGRILLEQIGDTLVPESGELALGQNESSESVGVSLAEKRLQELRTRNNLSAAKQRQESRDYRKISKNLIGPVELNQFQQDMTSLQQLIKDKIATLQSFNPAFNASTNEQDNISIKNLRYEISYLQMRLKNYINSPTAKLLGAYRRVANYDTLSNEDIEETRPLFVDLTTLDTQTLTNSWGTVPENSQN